MSYSKAGKAKNMTARKHGRTPLVDKVRKLKAEHDVVRAQIEEIHAALFGDVS